MGPLQGVRVIEVASLGPTPFCGMLLGDFGADVIRVDRPGPALGLNDLGPYDVMGRNKRSVVLDLKSPQGRADFLALVDTADVLLEGMRPGVMERFGLGPSELLQRRPRLVYGRMTGYGQTGPLANAAGHDINYAALAGVLAHIGTAQRPVVPLNLIADFGGGAMYLAFGVLAALLHAQKTGAGQVVDAAMVDGAGSLLSMFFGLSAMGQWSASRETNLLDGGAPFYAVYETKDGKWVSVGALEPQFYAVLLERLELDPQTFADSMNPVHWPAWRERFAERFRQRTQAEWEAHFEGHDACFAPVRSLADVHEHPHQASRAAFIEQGGVRQPAPAPRLSHTPGAITRAPPRVGAHTEEVLAELHRR